MNKEEIKLHVEQVFSGNTAPENYTNRDHCPECAEHDETLRSYTPKSIGLEQLGNPGWDPICFPTDYKQGEAGHIEDSHEKSEILLKITKPNGVDVILRDGYLGYFDPGNVPLKSNRRITRRMQGTACSRPDPDGF